MAWRKRVDEGGVSAGLSASHPGAYPMPVGAARPAVSGAGRHAAGAARGTGRALALGVMLALGVLAGCASTVPAQITTFNRQDAGGQGWAGRRFVVEPLAGQQGSLEYASHAQHVREALQKHGLVPVDASSAAELLVHLEYGAGGAMSNTRDSGVRSSVSFGVGGGFRTGWGLGIGIPVGSTSSGETLYRYRVQVQINRLSHGAAGPVTGERLYESTIVTQGESALIAPQMPALIKALLADFPGENGKTRTIRFPRTAADD